MTWQLPFVPDPAGYNQGVRLAANDSFVWVAEGDRIARINDYGEYSIIRPPAKPNTLNIAAMYATPAGMLWVSASGTLWTISADGKFTSRPLQNVHCDPNR